MLLNLLATAMLLIPAQPEIQNPWKARLPDAMGLARRESSPTAYWIAMDAAWRADDWQAGLELAREAAEKFTDDPRLTGPVARALWRSGLMLEAETYLPKLAVQSDDPVALHALILMRLARGELAEASQAAERLARQPGVSAADLATVMSVRLAADQIDGLAEMVRRIERMSDPANGYPETLLEEVVEGLPEFLEKAGSGPLSNVTAHGSAPMPVIPMINLPGCMVRINGKGPFRMIVDTGGSITLSLDTDIAEELGLEKLAEGSVRGVSGKDAAWQTVAGELQIGEIRCERVMTRVFGVRKATAFTADGILGTGVFADARMKLDFEHAELHVMPSSDEAAAGQEYALRIVGDAKLMAPVTIHGEPATALLDSGADVIALSPSRMKRLFPDVDPRSFQLPTAGVGAGEAPKITLSKGVDLEFGGRKWENVSGLGLDVLDTILSSYLGIQSDVLIGMPSFRQMKSFTVDFPKRRMWIEWLEPDAK